MQRRNGLRAWRLLNLLLPAALALAAAGESHAANAPVSSTAGKQRLIVLADMGNEPDEVQQMLHLLLYANEVDLEGLVAVTGKHLRPEDARPYRRVLHPELFHQLIDGYEKVVANLRLHAHGWPTPTQLRRIVATGQSGYGIADVGEGNASPGSRLILDAATRSDGRPLHIVVNAGANTLAQALYDYRATHTTEETLALVGKLRVYDNQAQDNAGAWVCHEFPTIQWIRSLNQTRDYGGPNNATLGPHVWKPLPYTCKGQDAWAAQHVRENHGPLGALYPRRVIFSDKVHFIEGGGTIPWMRLVSTGLTDPSEPSWGGWSGRHTIEKKETPFSRYRDVADEEKSSVPFAMHVDAEDRAAPWTDPDSGQTLTGIHVPVFRWRAAMWNDFQARMDWCVKPFAEANHRPQAVLNGDPSDSVLRQQAKPGDLLTFTAASSRDSDGDEVRYVWWFYNDAGRRPYGRSLSIGNDKDEEIVVSVPADAAGKELHLILEVWDRSPIVPLVDYRRAVISVEP